MVAYTGVVHAAEVQVGEVAVQLRRSPRRRTLGLQVRNGVATAHAPLAMPEARILMFLHTKRDWLARHVQAQREELGPALALGGSLPFLGEELVLVGDHLANSVRREGQTLIVPAQDWHSALIRWTRAAVLAPYTALVQDYAERLGAAPNLRSVRVSDTRSRWGSCTASGDIRLHWALSRAPLEVLRYVALHEAAHLLELNHSPRYWAHVARVMPDHAAHRAWLRKHGRSLLLGPPTE